MAAQEEKLGEDEGVIRQNLYAVDDEEEDNRLEHGNKRIAQSCVQRGGTFISAGLERIFYK